MKEKVIGMSADQFICLRYQKLIPECRNECKATCVNSWNICPYLRLTSVSLGAVGDIVCKEHIIVDEDTTKAETKEYVKNCKRRSYK
jgi:hypothetical protein